MQAPPDSAAVGEALLASFRHTFQQYKTLADHALAQLEPAEWLYRPAPGSNSTAVIVQHVVGNLRSRFTDFLTTDGEKPTRHREAEFDEPATADAVPGLQTAWHAAWQILFELLDSLQPADLLHTVTIRGEAHTVLLALQRQVAHYAMHVGQLVQLAKIIRGEAFGSLSIPRGHSVAFNARMINLRPGGSRARASPGLLVRKQRRQCQSSSFPRPILPHARHYHLAQPDPCRAHQPHHRAAGNEVWHR